MCFASLAGPLPNGHIVRSHMEASLCGDLVAAEVPHLHGSPETVSFEVAIGPRRRSIYVPSIVLTEARMAGRQVIVEPIDSVSPGGGERRLARMRRLGVEVLNG